MTRTGFLERAHVTNIGSMFYNGYSVVPRAARTSGRGEAAVRDCSSFAPAVRELHA
jgi:hypothetical protein